MMNNTNQNNFKTQLKGIFITALTAITLLACTDSDKTTSEKEMATLAGSRSTIEYDDGTNYSVVLTDKGFVEETSNAKGAVFLLNNEIVDWSLIKGLKPEQVKVFGSIPAGNNLKALLPDDNNGAISVYTVDYEFPKSTFDKSKAIYYVDGERLEELPETLRPEQIASMNILKGEAAVEKYGSNCKDGVIEIITKKSGEEDGKVDIIMNGTGRATRID